VVWKKGGRCAYSNSGNSKERLEGRGRRKSSRTTSPNNNFQDLGEGFERGKGYILISKLWLTQISRRKKVGPTLKTRKPGDLTFPVVIGNGNPQWGGVLGSGEEFPLEAATPAKNGGKKDAKNNRGRKGGGIVLKRSRVGRPLVNLKHAD